MMSSKILEKQDFLGDKETVIGNQKPGPGRGIAKNGGTRDGILAPFLDQNIGEDQKKRSLLQNELVFSPKVCDDQKKALCLPISGFLVSKEKNKWCHPKMVTPGAGRSPLTTPLGPGLLCNLDFTEGKGLNQK